METNYFCFKKVVLNSVTVIYNKYYINLNNLMFRLHLLYSCLWQPQAHTILQIRQGVGPLRVGYTLGLQCLVVFIIIQLTFAQS